MKDIGPIFRALTRNKLGALLIALQIALTLAIVTNAAFIIQERAANIARPSGLDEPNTSLFITNLFDSNVDQRQLYRDDLAALRSIPGVVAATTAQSIPISGSGWGENVYNDPEAQSNESINFGNFMVDEHGLDTFGLELVAGRNFRPDEITVRSLEDISTPEILIVSQALADELFPDGDALGKTVWDEPNGGRPMQVIGIYDHMQNAWPSSENVNNTALLPSLAMFGGEMMYVVRSEPGSQDRVMAAAEEYLSKKSQPNRGCRAQLRRTEETYLLRRYRHGETANRSHRGPDRCNRPGHRGPRLVQRDPKAQADWHAPRPGRHPLGYCALLHGGKLVGHICRAGCRAGRHRWPELVPGHTVQRWPDTAVVPADWHAGIVGPGPTGGTAARAPGRQHSTCARYA